MQSVTSPSRNITTVNNNDIVDQLLREIGLGRVCMCRVWFTLWVPSSGETSIGYFPGERTPETVDGVLREWRPVINHPYL